MPDIAKQNASNPKVVVYMPPNKLKNKVTLNGKIKGNGYDPKVLARANARVRAIGNDLLQAVATDMKRLEEICAKLDDDPSTENFETLEKIAMKLPVTGRPSASICSPASGARCPCFCARPKSGAR